MGQVEAATSGEDRASGWKWLLVLLLLGALVRLGLWSWWSRNTELIGDERDYNAIAIHLLDRGEFSLQAGQPTSIRPPLYPGMVAAVYWVAGLQNLQAVRLVQACISLATVVLVYFLGKTLYTPRLGILAGALFCFYPPIVGFNNMLLTETLFGFFFVATALACVRHLHTGTVWALVFAGLWCGLGALTRSALMYFPPILAVYVLLFSRERLARRLVAITGMLVVFSLVMLPWTIRNTRMQKTLTFVDCMGGRNLMMGNYEHTPLARTWAAIEVSGDKSWDVLLAAKFPESRTATQGQRDKLAMRYGLEYIRANPALTFKRDVVKFFNFWQLERTLIAGLARDQLGPVTRPVLIAVTLAIFGSQAFAMIAAIFGACMNPPADKRAHWLLLLMLAYICGMHTLIFGHSRYHLPLMPVVMVYSSAGIACVREIWSRRVRASFLLAATIACILVASWLFEIFIVDFDKFVRPGGA